MLHVTQSSVLVEQHDLQQSVITEVARRTKEEKTVISS